MLRVYCQIHCSIQHMFPSESVIDTMPLNSVIVTCLCERIKIFCVLMKPAASTCDAEEIDLVLCLSFRAS